MYVCASFVLTGAELQVTNNKLSLEPILVVASSFLLVPLHSGASSDRNATVGHSLYLSVHHKRCRLSMFLRTLIDFSIHHLRTRAYNQTTY